ncbi:hypothetical protein GGF32_008587 [Allomyces javanicus]|nr:hypothetical protein GGF32_008587 [Allomyces javanicus]
MSKNTKLPFRKLAVVPEALGFLRFLRDPDVCVCSFLVKGPEAPLFAARVVLARARASPYFRNMFSGPWAETQSKDPISFTSWDAPAVALAFVHIYAGWRPDIPLPEPTPAELVADFSCDPATLPFATWRNLFELAQYLGLKELAIATSRKLIVLIEEQARDLEAMPDTHPDDDDPGPRKRARRMTEEPLSAPAVASPASTPASTTSSSSEAPGASVSAPETTAQPTVNVYLESLASGSQPQSAAATPSGSLSNNNNTPSV